MSVASILIHPDFDPLTTQLQNVDFYTETKYALPYPRNWRIFISSISSFRMNALDPIRCQWLQFWSTPTLIHWSTQLQNVDFYTETKSTKSSFFRSTFCHFLLNLSLFCNSTDQRSGPGSSFLARASGVWEKGWVGLSAKGGRCSTDARRSHGLNISL